MSCQKLSTPCGQSPGGICGKALAWCSFNQRSHSSGSPCWCHQFPVLIQVLSPAQQVPCAASSCPVQLLALSEPVCSPGVWGQVFQQDASVSGDLSGMLLEENPDTALHGEVWVLTALTAHWNGLEELGGGFGSMISPPFPTSSISASLGPYLVAGMSDTVSLMWDYFMSIHLKTIVMKQQNHSIS